MAHRYRAIWLATLGVLAGALAAAAVAWACTPQANIFLSQTSARAGQTIGGHGVGFGPNDSPGVTPVQIRFNSLSGAALWAGSSDARGYFAFSFTAPAVAPGYYVIVAQRASGQPYRAVLQVVAPPAARPKHREPAAPHQRTPSVRQHTKTPTASHISTPVVAAPLPVAAPVPTLTQPVAPPAKTHHVINRTRHRPVVHAPPHPVELTTPALPPRVTTHMAAPRSRGSRGPAIPWYVLALGALALLGLGGATGAYVALRRHPRAPLSVAEAELPRRADPLEAELQQMLAEGTAAPLQREPILPDRR